jgi:hypothetical protein
LHKVCMVVSGQGWVLQCGKALGPQLVMVSTTAAAENGVQLVGGRAHHPLLATVPVRHLPLFPSAGVTG